MKILKELTANINELSVDMNSNADYFRKEPENIRRSQEKLENLFTEIQAELKALKNRMYNAGEWIRYLEVKIKEINQLERQIENQMEKKNESNMRDLWDNKKRANLHRIGIPEGEVKEKWLKIYLKKLWLKTFQI